MKPISLQGHERPITKVRFNREGDLLFSCAKDKVINVWYTVNGERLGTYGDGNSHSGAVWSLDVDWQTKNLVSGGADNKVRLWDVVTGKQIEERDTKSAVRTCSFSYSGNLIFFSTDKAMNQPCIMNVVDLRESLASTKSVMNKSIPDEGPKVTAQVWSDLDSQVTTGHDNGDVVHWDLRKDGSAVNRITGHDSTVTDMQTDVDCTIVITASKDKSAKLFDIHSLDCLKTYASDRPINTASISPKYDHVVLGGGQEARNVTTTSSREGKFEAQFFHMIFEEEFARVKAHFGPMNSVQFMPDGTGYVTGGEDGYVRLQWFDKPYYEFNFEC